jgi:hypothetical protein
MQALQRNLLSLFDMCARAVESLRIMAWDLQYENKNL